MKKAIDIVLFPSDDTTDFIIHLNKSWVRGIEDEIALNKKTCLPHITLAMGIIDDTQIIEIKNNLKKIASQFSPLDLKIKTVKVIERSDGRKLSRLEIEKSLKLQKLHETVMDKLVPFFTYDNISKEMFYSPPAVNKIPSWWVKGYVKTEVRENYQAHITLGMGVPDKLNLPILFKASKIALCHLGNYCTCRNVLAEVPLD